uniref:Lectin alpha chain n=1 Tax=Dioclea guianensis TaxID=99571 RepID=LECA_DIOGU|nr:RecName: Full=Lectin alpha chain; Contains: RecName: Full=Lectin beta chain; Contains: RecName: Full=Lectin gamma-1 chain; Contains: RecName: Full=Lectin gamma-2 chain [Dioclea guianensis]
ADTIVAVELDSYPNTDIGDPSYPHIGIDIKSIRSKSTARWNMQTGKVGTAHISYNSVAKRLSAVVSYTGSSSTTVSYDVDLNNVLPEWVRVGLSATTGLYKETNTILSWSFTSKLKTNSIADANSLHFSFNQFSQNPKDLILQSDATTDSDGNLELTKVSSSGDPQGSSVGRALFYAPVHIWEKSAVVAGFDATFTFLIKSPDRDPADGITFFIANTDTSIPSGSGGRLLGLFPDAN